MSTTRSTGDRLAAFTHELSQAYDLAEPRVVRRELAAVFEHGLPTDASAVPAANLPAKLRRRRMLTTLGGVLATVTGKVVLGTAIAAASVGAAHTAGVVDVPGLPDMAPAVESPDFELPDEANNDHPDSDGESGVTGSPESSGVDGADVSDRATSGEPKENGREFGRSIADEATEGTPAEGKVGGENSGKPDTTPGGNDNNDPSDDTPSPPAPADQP